ncbi:hypothetical protein E4U19_003584 [Claviceps sp. Clav32 group G5]|nr:hypothetical protein E4U19_003584 [Claviceps sp. Clav32 group G5]
MHACGWCSARPIGEWHAAGPQPLGGGSAMQSTAAATERDSSLYNEPSTPHPEPSDHRHRPWLSMFPPVSSESSPRPANAVAPTNFTATTISHHYNAITTITTGASHCHHCYHYHYYHHYHRYHHHHHYHHATAAPALLQLVSSTATSTPPPAPVLDLNLRRLHAQPSLVDDFSQGRLLKPQLDIATLLTPVW